METIPENLATSNATVPHANGTNTTTTTTLPVTTTLTAPEPKTTSSKDTTPSSPTLFAALLSLFRSVQAIITPYLLQSLKSHLSPLLQAYAAQLAAHPHLTTFLTLQLLFATVPLLLFTFFATGTVFFSLFLALLGVAAICMAVVGGALMVLVPVLATGIIVGGIAWIWCWGMWYGVDFVGRAFGLLEGKGSTDGARKGPGGNKDSMRGWETMWERWRGEGKGRAN
ncbi:hypothetical protein AJ79_00585 [Helicocarpus griseus UAMH5409]|uniref:Uncharacterized protein n=1 Tax=Helicocarpus griseus UAMH5409 TaxID=1447875 RepID=A0A2B7Y9P3_9EURO|nr:hypothetical protein AJ79_00585 [Helicocarpus griseus UAMH5409]